MLRDWRELFLRGRQLILLNLSGDTVIIDLSSSFISSATDVNVASNMVYSIVNTLTELTEVNGVKFLIDGAEVSSFANCDFALGMPFVRK